MRKGWGKFVSFAKNKFTKHSSLAEESVAKDIGEKKTGEENLKDFYGIAFDLKFGNLVQSKIIKPKDFLQSRDYAIRHQPKCLQKDVRNLVSS